MKKLIFSLWERYKELILYGIFGLGATLINIFSFYAFDKCMGMSLMPANVLAWVLAFVFAFLTNKFWVFESKGGSFALALKEGLNFFIARAATLVIDVFAMWVMVDVLLCPKIPAKISVNVIIIIVNYIASKFWVFAHKENKDTEV